MKYLIFLLITLYFTGCVPMGKAYAQSYSNQDFLNFTPEIKKHWVASMVATLGHVAFFKDKAITECIWDWYYKAPDLAQRYGVIEAYMKQHPDYAPSQILIAITEKECGAYIRD